MNFNLCPRGCCRSRLCVRGLDFSIPRLTREESLIEDIKTNGPVEDIKTIPRFLHTCHNCEKIFTCIMDHTKFKHQGIEPIYPANNISRMYPELLFWCSYDKYYCSGICRQELLEIYHHDRDAMHYATY